MLRSLCSDFQVVPADIDETLSPGPLPQTVARLALDKARAVAARLGDGVILGADTVVVVAGDVLGKPADAEEAIEASHLLVSYQGAMRASPTVTRTKDEAKARAAEAAAKAKKGEAFDKLVAEYSDEPNAAARKGSLGAFTRTRMVKPFADAAFCSRSTTAASSPSPRICPRRTI